MLFLVENGFDLNNHIKNGIPFYPGNGTEDSAYNEALRSLFLLITSLSIPIIVHNGLLDLIFIYNSFYAELPSQLSVFLCDLTEMFKGGIYDTKYIADYIDREESSFLAFLFRK